MPLAYCTTSGWVLGGRAGCCWFGYFKYLFPTCLSLGFVGTIDTYFIWLFNCWFSNEVCMLENYIVKYAEYSITNNSGLLAVPKPL